MVAATWDMAESNSDPALTLAMPTPATAAAVAANAVDAILMLEPIAVPTAPRAFILALAELIAEVKLLSIFPAIFIASWYSVLALAKNLSRLLRHVGQLPDGQAQEIIHACPQGN
jgi:hypothetical protein